MRFFPELSLLLILTISPLLALGGLSLQFPIPGTWILLACGTSAVFAMLTILRVRNRLVQPLQTLVRNLYTNTETPRGHQPPELQELVQAIRFNATAANVDAMNRINELEQQISNNIDNNKQHARLLDKEKSAIEQAKIEMTDATRRIDAQTILSRAAVEKLVRAASSVSLHADAITEMENLQFLLSDSPNFGAADDHNLLRMIDRVISITAPLAKIRNVIFHVEFEPACPCYFDLDARQFASCLFQLIINYLQPSDRKQEAQAQVFINVSKTGPGFKLTFPDTANQNVGRGLDELLESTDATWDGSSLTFPATVSHSTVSVKTSLSAIIVAEDERLRASLTRRLGILGVNCISDFKNQHLDICMVADETSEAFLAIKPHLPESVFVLILNNHRYYQHPRWVSLENPVTQVQLAQVMERISQSRDIASQKNVLVVDDSEANTQLLESQLKELGHTVTTAGTGENGVSLAANRLFQMIFMDIQLPGIDGMEATRRIRQGNRTVPIFGLTAHATPEEKKQCLAAGMNEVLIKPVRMQNLRAISQQLAQPESFAPLATPGAHDLPVFDLDLALANANDRIDLAAEMFELLLAELPSDLDAINAASGDIGELKRAAHKLHGAVRFCGVPRLAKAVEKLEQAAKDDNQPEIQLRLKLLNGEADALNTWHQNNPDVLNGPGREIKRSW